MSPDLQRILRIREYCVDIQVSIERYGNDRAAFEADLNFQYSVAFAVLQIGELTGGLSSQFRSSTESQIQWGAIKGMRNIIVHGYGNVDLDVLWETATVNNPELKAFCDVQLGKTKE